MLPETFRRLGPKHQLRVAWALRAVCLAVGFVVPTHAQETTERLLKVVQWAQITDAVMISNVAVAGKTIECGLFIKPPAVDQPVTPFDAGDDWLQQMTISLVNRTNKTIVFGSIFLHFLDTGDCRTQPCAGVELKFGQMPAADAYEAGTGQPIERSHLGSLPLSWGPEQTMVVHVSDYMPEIEENLANSLPVSDVTKVNVYRGVFYFAGGMKWTLGRYSVPDPDRPGKFTPLLRSYFPGLRGRNWPPGYNQ